MQAAYTRPLSNHQSISCEQAIHPRCKCRCNGLLHGISHKQYQEIEHTMITKLGSVTQEMCIDIVRFVKGEV